MPARALIVFLLLSGLPLFAQSNDRIMQEAMSPTSPLAENLRVLTDDVGGRVPGTPAMQQAIRWGVDGFKAAGADSVHTEEFTIPASWAEGATEVKIVAPEEFRVRATSIAWGPALKPSTARVVDVGSGSEADFAKAGNVEGAIILVAQRSAEDMGGPVRGVLSRAGDHQAGSEGQGAGHRLERQPRA